MVKANNNKLRYTSRQNHATLTEELHQTKADVKRQRKDLEEERRLCGQLKMLLREAAVALKEALRVTDKINCCYHLVPGQEKTIFILVTGGPWKRGLRGSGYHATESDGGEALGCAGHGRSCWRRSVSCWFYAVRRPTYKISKHWKVCLDYNYLNNFVLVSSPDSCYLLNFQPQSRWAPRAEIRQSSFSLQNWRPGIGPSENTQHLIQDKTSFQVRHIENVLFY